MTATHHQTERFIHVVRHDTIVVPKRRLNVEQVILRLGADDGIERANVHPSAHGGFRGERPCHADALFWPPDKLMRECSA